MASSFMLIDPRRLVLFLASYDDKSINNKDAQAGMAICGAHADTVTVPDGWELVDERLPEAELIFLDVEESPPEDSSEPISDSDAGAPEAEEVEQEIDPGHFAEDEASPLLSRAFRAAGLE